MMLCQRELDLKLTLTFSIRNGTWQIQFWRKAMNQKKEQFGGLDKRNAAGAAALALLIAGTAVSATPRSNITARSRSEEHTSELQSRFDLVCRLLLEKKKNSDASSALRHARRRTICWPRGI